MCDGMLPVDATQQNHCLTIVGDLQKIRVKGTQSYCAAPFQGIPESNSWVQFYFSLFSSKDAVMSALGNYGLFKLCFRNTDRRLVVCNDSELQQVSSFLDCVFMFGFLF